MKNVAGMYVQQTRLFAPDVVPYRYVITPLGINRLKQALEFSSSSWLENLEYGFQDGTIEFQGKRAAVTWISFLDRRIVVQVFGDSAAANAAYSSISEVLVELAPDFKSAVPLVSSEETSCAVQLDFDWATLFNPALADQVSRWTRKLSSEQVERFIKGVSVRFTLGVGKKSIELSEQGITLYDQALTVESRADTPLSERIYHTYSPCDSDTHLRLVAELEANLLSRGAGGRSRRKVSGK